MFPLIVAASLHIGPSAGIGLGYGLAGVRLDVGYGHVAAFGGVGFVDFPDPDEFSAAATAAPVVGLRLYSGDGDRFFLSFEGAYFSTHNVFQADLPSEYFDAERYVFGADIGYRHVLGTFATVKDDGWRACIEVSAGPAFSRVHASGVGASGQHSDFGWDTHFGIMEPAHLPNLSVALGVESF